MNKILFLLAVMASVSVANEIKPVYTDKEVHEMATSYKTMVDQGFKSLDDIPMIFQSSEFRGYVGGMLDTQEMFKECAKTHTLQEITYKTAMVVDSLDVMESAPSAVTMFVGVGMACDDSGWEKK